MTLEIPMKIERFMARRLRSCVFVKNFGKTLGAIWGTKTQFFFEKKVFWGDPRLTLSNFEVKINIYQ